jgi:hypothetical protein
MQVLIVFQVVFRDQEHFKNVSTFHYKLVWTCCTDFDLDEAGRHVSTVHSVWVKVHIVARTDPRS